MTALLAIALILLAAIVFSVLVAAIMRRFGIVPVDEQSRSRGFGDVLGKFKERARK